MDYSIIIYRYPSIIHDPWLKILVDHVGSKSCRDDQWAPRGGGSDAQDSDGETSHVGWLRIGMMVRELTDSMHILRSWKFEPFFLEGFELP